MADMRSMMERLGLAVNEAKSGIRRIPEESVEFLGYTIGRCYSRQTGRAYVVTRPSKRSVRRGDKSGEPYDGPTYWALGGRVAGGGLNRMLTEWGRYFCLGPVTPAYRAVDAHTRRRLRRWLWVKHKRRVGPRSASRRVPLRHAGAGALGADDPGLAVGEGMRSQREPGAGEPHARFDERGLET